jgi:hypothetical protein
VKSQIKPKIRLKEGEERGDFTEKSRLEEMKELY